MTRVFISHSSEERELATYLADWIEKSLPETKCFCSSRPTNLPPGREWLRDIYDNAKISDLCLMLLSPYSASNNWLHFEAGLVLGAADIADNRVVPVLYGGIPYNNVPQTVRHIQYLSLEDSANFNAFISEHFLMKKEPSPGQMHEAFKEGLSSKAARLLKYGEFGSWISDKVLTEKLTHPISLKGGQGIHDDSFTKKRFNNFGELISIRAKIIPVDPESYSTGNSG